MTKAIKNVTSPNTICYYILYYIGDKKYSTMFYAKDKEKAIQCLQNQFPFLVEIEEIFPV